MVILPVDQGFEHGPARSFAASPPAYDPRYHFELAREAGCNVYAAPLGFLEAGARDFAGQVPLILKVNDHDVLVDESDPHQALTGSVADALRLGCVGIGFTIYPGSTHRLEMYQQIRAYAEEAKRCGLVVVVWSYGRDGSELTLTLVYNPVAPSLPPDQATLESAYRRELKARYEIEFNCLFTITNMPISRYLEHLIRTGQFEQYMQKLINAFNPAAISGLMCRSTLSVGWDGRLFDCDFNQMLNLEVGKECPANIEDFNHDSLSRREIVIGQHCYGCTAGAGSGCQGAISH